MSSNRHRQIRALLAAVAPLGLIACSDPYGDFDSSACAHRSDGLSDLNPAEDVDFITLRRVQGFSEDATPVVVSSFGEACATASDAAACSTLLDGMAMDAPLTSRSLQITDEYDVAFTRGDEVATVSQLPALIELLGGVIDTSSEAALVAFAAGFDPLCGENNVRAVGDGFELLGQEGQLCGGDVSHYLITVSASGEANRDEGEVVEHGDDSCAIGRRPEALASRTRRAQTLGAFFANAAHLEAASVPAFEQLAVELAVHAAPRALVRAALRARGDEIRHARATAALARRYGAVPTRPRVGPRAVRSLFEVALDNATEGCVRETFGAAVAQVQTRRAATPRLRRELGTIAREETRHAALSWAIDDWMRGRLSPRERRLLAEARGEAARTLRARSEESSPRVITDVAGVPGAEGSVAMASKLSASLWQS